jgi:peptide chain release factor 3
MELEKQRGISISSTVLQFDYAGCAVNLLDTPGHKDFLRGHLPRAHRRGRRADGDRRRQGRRTQTRKLFEVCRRRGVPIFTFMNKCDRPTRNPIDLLDELETVLGLQASPVIWPLGNGPSFRGVFDRRSARSTSSTRARRQIPGPGQRHLARGPVVREKLDDYTFDEVKEQLAMLDGAGHPFDLAAVQAGQQTPVYFGSAVNNFGIQLLLDGFLQDSVPPHPAQNPSPCQ